MAADKSANSKTEKPSKISHPGMMGDGTEEQNLNQPGNPSARINRKEVEDAFGREPKKESTK